MRYHFDGRALLLHGDALDILKSRPDGSVNCIVTSPPYYGLRDYGTPGQYGLEASPAAYVETMRALFAEARRVLADDGTLWLNIGDSYAHGGSGAQGAAGDRAGRTFTAEHMPGSRALPTKNLLGIPWRVAFALQDDGWILRNAIVWHKPNAMPESVRDRMSKRYEEIFLFSKSPKYWFDLDAVREPHVRQAKGPKDTEWVASTSWNHNRLGEVGTHPNGKNPGDVWSIATRPYPQAHFATFPIDLPLRCIKAGCKPNGVVLDPFSGAGTTGLAARRLGRRYVGIDLNADYHDLAIERFESLKKAA